MSFNKALKFALEKFADHPEIWIGVGFVFILLVCFLIFKFIRRQSSQEADNAPAMENTGTAEKNSLATVMASLNEEDRRQAENLTQDEAEIDAAPPLATAESISPAEEVTKQDDDSDLIDELRIPRQGTEEADAPVDDDMHMPHMQTHDIEDAELKTKTTQDRPEKIGRFLGRKKRGRDEKTRFTLTGNASDISSLSANRNELIEIERKLLALRELHDAGLIATEIYLLKSREFAKKSKR